MSVIRFMMPPEDVFGYGYTVKRQPDGKFHAYIIKNDETIQDLPFGRRKIAKARAYHWYENRMATLRSQEDAAIARRELKERAKPKPTETEKKINSLKKRIDNAQKRQHELLKAIRQGQSRITRASKLNMKWWRKEQQWTKQLQRLQDSTNQRITAFVKEFATEK